MRTDMRRDLTAAITTRDRVAIAALRSALAAIDNAEAPPAGESASAAGGEYVAGALVGNGAGEADRRELTDAQLRVIIEAEVAERVAAERQYRSAGRTEAADRVRAEAEVLGRYLA